MSAMVLPVAMTLLLCFSCVSCVHLGQHQRDEPPASVSNTQTDATKTSSPNDRGDAPAAVPPESDATTKLHDDDLRDDVVTAQLQGEPRSGEDLAALRPRPDTVDFQRTVFPGETSGVRDALRLQLSSSFGQFLECARTHLENPDDMPRVVVEFTIGADGRVTDAVAEGPQPYSGCVSSAIEQIRFSLPTPEPLRVRYPVYP